jgi:hypothetical protein
MLLYPEKGLVLNSTATEVVPLCVSDLTVGWIIEQLASRNGYDPGAVEREVTALLTALLERGLIHEAVMTIRRRRTSRCGHCTS